MLSLRRIRMVQRKIETEILIQAMIARIAARALMTRHMIVKTLRRIWLTLTLQMLRVLLRCQELEKQELKQL